MADQQIPNQNPYQQPSGPAYRPEAYGAQPPRGLSIASLVIGIASFFLGFTFIVPIIGFILGLLGLKREPAGRGFAIAGIWINIAILVVTIVLTLLLIAFIGVPLFALIPYLLDTGSFTA
ncbi:DUF4190 domain-containing protein [Marisediminicola sp. LYQ134]|uniref:DUF4190 domain-containing protein n=1 Tax=unclassified Marisediminicola TaxID=2618316 RepID=UPI00398341A0